MTVEILQDLVKHVVGQPQGQPCSLSGALGRFGGRLHDRNLVLHHWGGAKDRRAFLLESYMPLACPCSLAKRAVFCYICKGCEQHTWAATESSQDLHR